MSKPEGTERGAQSNSDNSEEQDWAAVKALFDNVKTTKKPHPVRDYLFT